MVGLKLFFPKINICFKIQLLHILSNLKIALWCNHFITGNRISPKSSINPKNGPVTFCTKHFQSFNLAVMMLVILYNIDVCNFAKIAFKIDFFRNFDFLGKKFQNHRYLICLVPVTVQRKLYIWRTRITGMAIFVLLNYICFILSPLNMKRSNRYHSRCQFYFSSNAFTLTLRVPYAILRILRI